MDNGNLVVNWCGIPHVLTHWFHPTSVNSGGTAAAVLQAFTIWGRDHWTVESGSVVVWQRDVGAFSPRFR